jgi:hypothetical protein
MHWQTVAHSSGGRVLRASCRNCSTSGWKPAGKMHGATEHNFKHNFI